MVLNHSWNLSPNTGTNFSSPLAAPISPIIHNTNINRNPTLEINQPKMGIKLIMIETIPKAIEIRAIPIDCRM